jgi:hypothetical protein
MDIQAEPKLSDRDEFALAKYYVRMLRIIAHEQVRQRKLLEAVITAFITQSSEEP